MYKSCKLHYLTARVTFHRAKIASVAVQIKLAGIRKRERSSRMTDCTKQLSRGPCSVPPFKRNFPTDAVASPPPSLSRTCNSKSYSEKLQLVPIPSGGRARQVSTDKISCIRQLFASALLYRSRVL